MSEPVESTGAPVEKSGAAEVKRGKTPEQQRVEAAAEGVFKPGSVKDIATRLRFGSHSPSGVTKGTFSEAVGKLGQTIFGIVNIEKDESGRDKAKELAYKHLQSTEAAKVQRGIHQDVMRAGGADKILPGDYIPKLLGMFGAAVKLAGTDKDLETLKPFLKILKDSKKLPEESVTELEGLIKSRTQQIKEFETAFQVFADRTQQAKTKEEVENIKEDFGKAKVLYQADVTLRQRVEVFEKLLGTLTEEREKQISPGPSEEILSEEELSSEEVEKVFEESTSTSSPPTDWKKASVPKSEPKYPGRIGGSRPPPLPTTRAPTPPPQETAKSPPPTKPLPQPGAIPPLPTRTPPKPPTKPQ